MYKPIGDLNPGLQLVKGDKYDKSLEYALFRASNGLYFVLKEGDKYDIAGAEKVVSETKVAPILAEEPKKKSKTSKKKVG